MNWMNETMALCPVLSIFIIRGESMQVMCVQSDSLSSNLSSSSSE